MKKWISTFAFIAFISFTFGQVGIEFGVMKPIEEGEKQLLNNGYKASIFITGSSDERLYHKFIIGFYNYSFTTEEIKSTQIINIFGQYYSIPIIERPIKFSGYSIAMESTFKILNKDFSPTISLQPHMYQLNYIYEEQSQNTGFELKKTRYENQFVGIKPMVGIVLLLDDFSIETNFGASLDRSFSGDHYRVYSDYNMRVIYRFNN